MELLVRPVAYVRSPFDEKVEAPRQGSLAKGARGTVELLAPFRDALADLDGFDRIWLLFWFHRAEGWRPKVLPPRSDEKRGVFATRSPHRPNPIGMTAVRLVRVDDLVLHVEDLDLVDGTPVLDVKPYVPYADAFPEASAGWIASSDPREPWTVSLDPTAEDHVAWVEGQTSLDLRARLLLALSLGPQAHAYRRIRELPDGTRVLAIKEWRARFRVAAAERRITVERIDTGYRARDLARGSEPVHAIHRDFVARYGEPPRVP